ncbi:hypothetical protein VaNZ11_009167 [Volvox africanus]|uniref:Rab-GAP TBC domain-containing protein n=1 Tax=Volvox africanus TaxID=51714 RepID=A0ABQ5S6R6_9CHLO|nr:hypothetical protein VaNZ11_009167 [Volvox africanus]
MEHFSKALAAVSKVGEVISRTAQSAQELLRDQELRSKGIQTVITGAQTRLQGFQNGIVQRAGRIQERLLDNRRQLQALLQSLEERFNASQRAWQLQARRRDRVDVQFGQQVIENAPQEIRARLWYVLLENPHLAAPLKCEHPGVAHYSLLEEEIDGEDLLVAGGGGAGGGGSGAAAASPSSLTRRSAGGRDGAQGSAGSISSTGSRFAAAAAAAFGFNRSSGPETSLANSPSATSFTATRRDRSVSGRSGVVADTTLEATPQPNPQQQQQQPHLRMSAMISPQTGRTLRAGAAAAAAAAPAAEVASAAGAAAAESGVGDSLDGWELVSGVLCTTDPSGLPGPGPSASGTSGMLQPEAIRIIMEHLDALGPVALDESGSDPVLVAQQAVLEAMLQVPWESGTGLPTAIAPDSRFAVLNEMTAGQEEVDDSILRDIHRTFPEHPYFGMEEGQKSLFRVLKAYSLHDLEVAYCQGMAFMAGVLLMYVPEETAFRLFCRLMDAEGPNLRRLYLPGLEPLKAELATFELLLTWRMPELAAHLSEFGLPPVLYVSQWLMTLFATPFPPAFCARVIDVLLQDGHDRLLLRCSYAVMEVLELELLARHDFEALITYLKMEPLTWELGRQRAIMERALTSPLTDADIDIARDTVANRKFLAAALAAEAAASIANTELSGGGAGSSAMAGDLLGGPAAEAATATKAVNPAAVMHQRERSLEAEVDAALALAAAAALTATVAEGGAGCNAMVGVEGLLDGGDGGGGGGSVQTVGCEATGAATAVTPVLPNLKTCLSRRDGAGNMICFDEDGTSGSVSGAMAAAGSGSTRGAGGGSSVCRGTSPQRQPGRGWEPEWPVGPPHELGHRLAGGAQETTRATAGCSGMARQPGGSRPPSYGMSTSLLDDLDFGCGGDGATVRPKATPDLEYGEYGEMVMDAGLLLPELGTAGTVDAPPTAVAVAVAAGASVAAAAAVTGNGGAEGFFVPLGTGLGVDAVEPARAGTYGNPRQQRHHPHPGQQVQSGTDLLLD